MKFLRHLLLLRKAPAQDANGGKSNGGYGGNVNGGDGLIR
jgi:hypothetical protein